MNLLKILFGIRKAKLKKPIINDSFQHEKIIDWKYICPECGKGINSTILSEIHKDYCKGNETFKNTKE